MINVCRLLWEVIQIELRHEFTRVFLENLVEWIRPDLVFLDLGQEVVGQQGLVEELDLRPSDFVTAILKLVLVHFSKINY